MEGSLTFLSLVLAPSEVQPHPGCMPDLVTQAIQLPLCLRFASQRWEWNLGLGHARQELCQGATPPDLPFGSKLL